MTRRISALSKGSCRYLNSSIVGAMASPFDLTCARAVGSKAVASKEPIERTSGPKYYWHEVRDSERKHREERRQSYLDKRPQRLAKEEVQDLVGSKRVVDELLDRDNIVEPESSDTGAIEMKNSREAHTGIREMTPEASSTGDVQPAALPMHRSEAHETLLSCRSAGAVLKIASNTATRIGTATSASEALGELALALHLLGRWAATLQRASIVRDSRLRDVLSVLTSNVALLESWALVSALWGLARLGMAHECGPALIKTLSAVVPDLDLDQAALAVRSLGRSAQLGGSKAAKYLQEDLLTLLRERCSELKPETAAALIPALVQLKVSNSAFIAALAHNVAKHGHQLHVHDMAAASSALVKLRTVDPSIFKKATVAVQQNVHLCTPRAVVQFSLALRDVGEPDTFRDYLMPAARSFLYDFSCRDLCTLGESFCRARVADADFLCDLAFSLEPKVGEMEVHEVSVALSIFSQVGHAVPQLIGAVANRVYNLADDLSPRQLARTFHGLQASGCSEQSLYEKLTSRALELSHVLYASHAIDILMAVTEGGYATGPAYDVLFAVIQRNMGKLQVVDLVATMHIISQMSISFEDHVPIGFVEEALHAIRQRSRGTWRLELEHTVHLLEAFRTLWLEDDVIMELICRQLPAALGTSDCSIDELLRILGALADLPRRNRLHVRTHLHRRPKLQEAFRDCVSSHLARRLTPEEQVPLARACARLGYESEMTQAWLDRLVVSIEDNLHDLPPDVLCDLSWTLAEYDWQIEWNRRCINTFLQIRYGDDIENHTDELKHFVNQVGCKAYVSAEALLRLAWACVVINEDVPIALLDELFSLHNGLLPSEKSGQSLKFLQTIALHKDLSGRDSMSLSSQTNDWLSLAKDVPREDLHAPQTASRAQRKKNQPSLKTYPHEHWLSATLAQLRLPHEAGAIVSAHRVAIAFRSQQQVIDVLSLEDISAPAGRTMGSANLRRRQLMQLGWAVHSAKLRDLYDALRRGTLRLLVSKLLNSFDPSAARRSSFRTPLIARASGRPLHVLPSRGAGKDVPTKDDSKTTTKDEEWLLLDEEEDPFLHQHQSSRNPLRSRSPRNKLHERALEAVAVVSSHDKSETF